MLPVCIVCVNSAVKTQYSAFNNVNKKCIRILYKSYYICPSLIDSEPLDWRRNNTSSFGMWFRKPLAFPYGGRGGGREMI